VIGLLSAVPRLGCNWVLTQPRAFPCNIHIGALVPRRGTTAGVPGPRRNADDRDAGWFAPVATRRRPMLAAFWAASAWLATPARGDDPPEPPAWPPVPGGSVRWPGSVCWAGSVRRACTGGWPCTVRGLVLGAWLGLGAGLVLCAAWYWGLGLVPWTGAIVAGGGQLAVAGIASRLVALAGLSGESRWSHLSAGAQGVRY
jgi:hypothetical protein